MRLVVSTICLILSGVFVVEGQAFQLPSLPELPGAPGASEQLPDIAPEPDFQNVLLETQTALDLQPVPAAQVEPATLNEYTNVFENALSQFPQDRVARLPQKTQETSPIIEKPRFPAKPAMKTILPSQDMADQPSKLFQNPLDKYPPLSQFRNASSFKPSEEASETASSQESWLIDKTPLQPSIDQTQLPSTDAGSFQAKPAPKDSLTEPAQWQVPQTMAIVPDYVSGQVPSFQQTPGQDSMTWWKAAVMYPLDGTRQTEPVDSHVLVYRALQNSPRIQAVSQDPLIRELQIVEADAEFDAIQFIRSQFEDRVDPVGNQLTVGNGESFLKDNIWSADLGLRKKNRNGANWELNQRLGFQNSNSNFFVPQDQGTATLALNVTQPLLRGRGRYVNESQILIAQATNGAAWQTFQSEIQDELLGVVSAYWDLYLTRSVFLQKQRNVERGQKILSRLEGRSGLDSLPSQIARARSSVQTRRTELANALRDVLNAETEVRRRTADNSWMSGGGMELIPGELPSAVTFQLPLEQVVYSALQHRPEVHEAMNRVRIASVQRDVSANELLPELSLLMGTYVSALRADTGILNAFQDQFGQVKPGYSFGVNFELPYRNRAARSRLAQRKLQVQKIRHEVDEVMQQVIAESQVALRRVESAAETLVAASEAINAAHADRNQFERRWESFALVEGDLADGQNPTNVLDQLLDSQDRLASAELVFVQAERELKVSEVALQRAMGTLLMTQSVDAQRGFDNDVPRMDLFKDGNLLPSAANAIPSIVAPHVEIAPAAFHFQQ